MVGEAGEAGEDDVEGGSEVELRECADCHIVDDLERHREHGHSFRPVVSQSVPRSDQEDSYHMESLLLVLGLGKLDAVVVETGHVPLHLHWWVLVDDDDVAAAVLNTDCLLYTSPSPRDQRGSRMPSSA